jgi:predicted porin
MKKHLVVAAVAASLAVPAVAQVSISGTFEAAYSSQSLNSVRTSGFGNIVGTPGIVISASEDLGGGLKAGITLNSEFNSMSGVEYGSAADGRGNSTSDPDLATFEESSLFVSGAFGKVKFGRFNHAVRDNGGNYRFFGDLGRVDSEFRTMNKEVASGVEYSTPNVQGFSATVGYSNDATKTAAAAAPHVTTAGLRYKAGAFDVGAGWTHRDENGARKGSLITVGGSYNLGVAKVGYLNATQRDVAFDEETTANVLQVAFPAGKGLSIGATYHAYKSTIAATNGTTMGLMAKYDLSKRTSLFAAYLTAKNTGGGSFAPASLVGATDDVSNNGAGVSLVHKF